MVALEERKVAIIAILCSLFLLGSMSGIAFASSGNWVEVTRYTGGGAGFGMSPAFTCDHVDWRVRWQNSPMFDFGDQSIRFYVVPTENVIPGHFDGGMGIAFVSSREEENGKLYMDDSAGIFHLWIGPSSSNWELIVEQNIDSIPEFPSWTILPLFLAATAFALAVRKRGLHNISKPSNQL